MENRKFVGTCANGVNVFNRNDGHNDVHPVEDSLLQEALSNLSPTKDFEVFCFNFDRVIGKTTCVAVAETDTVVMAHRIGRKGPTPMVLGRNPEDCSSLVVILKKVVNDDYILITTFVGKPSEKEPWDPYLVPGSPEHQRAEAFWSTHALIYDETIIAKMA